MRRSTIVLAAWLVAMTLTATTAQAAGAGARSETESQLLARRLAELEADNADLERRMAHYRSSLEQAVAELNRLRGHERIARRAAEGRARHDLVERSVTRRSALELGERLLSSPRTTVKGRRAEVSGEISNPNREHVYGTLVVELLRDGMPVGEARVPFDVPSHKRVAYSQAFELRGYVAGSYSARVGLEY